MTNLFPPQELGGYGRKMWEFAHVLSARGVVQVGDINKERHVLAQVSYLLMNG